MPINPQPPVPIIPAVDAPCPVSAIPDDLIDDCAGSPALRVSLCRQDDFEFACAQDDGRLILLRYTADEDGVLVLTVLEINGSPSTAIPVVCPSRTIEMAPSQVVCVDGVEFTQVPVVDLASLPPAQLATLWFNAVGTIVADPTPGAISVTLGACPVTTDVEYTACDDTLVPVTVDSVVGAYVLNSEHKHTERVYDNITATLGGTLTTIITGTNVGFDFTGIVATNWVGAQYHVDFGNGFTDVGGNHSFDFVNEPDGNYEIKMYRGFAFPEGWRWFLVSAIEITKTGSTITVASTNPVPINRSITYSSEEMLQDYCGNTPVGVPYMVDGTPATINGTVVLTYHEPFTEWLGATDANGFPVTVTVPVTLLSGSASIGNGTFASTLGPDGTAWVAPATLKSVTVRARRSNANNATLTAPNRVVVTTAIGVTVLLTNETFTWSVEDINMLGFVQVETFGNSAAYIEWVQA